MLVEVVLEVVVSYGAVFSLALDVFIMLSCSANVASSLA